MNYIGGPSLDILAGELVSATAESYIPYAPTMSKYVTADEAKARWENLSEWYRTRKHFWIGTGPYYLEGAFPVEGTVIVRNNPDFVDNADRWAGYTTPKVPLVEVDGPGRVTIGQEAAYDVFVTFEGAPYAQADIEGVTYLVFDATGALAAQGAAEAVADGQYKVTLSADQTGKLPSGANKIEVVVVSKLVAIPASGSLEFVTQ
jgi:peptide/nickel transport system substrate-binding protein